MYKRQDKNYIKSDVLILGENKPEHEVRYIHSTFGFGTWTFYGGHDPEDYRHYVTAVSYTHLDVYKRQFPLNSNL